MKVLILFAALLQSSIEAREAFSFLSYNIQLKGLDEPGHAWENRKEAIFQIICNQDISALQEISHDQFMDLKHFNPHLKYIGVNSMTGGCLREPAASNVEGMAVFYNPDRFIVMECQSYWFSDTPLQPSQNWGNWQTSFSKMLQTCHFQEKLSRKNLVVLNNHYCHEEPPEGTFNPRLASAKFEINLIKEFMEQGYAIISAGDRNTHLPRDQQVWDIFNNQEGLSDADDRRKGLNATFIGYENHPRVNQIKADGSMAKSINLDKIYYSGQLKLLSAQVLSGLYDKDGCLVDDSGDSEVLQLLRSKRLYASDHAAYQLEFKLK